MPTSEKKKKRRTLRRPPIELVRDPKDAAKSAKLIYISDDKHGITRKKTGKSFRYVGVDGKPIKDPKTLSRISALAIPPAYKDVWISPNPRGHIQATGRDEKGRKQYRYHPRWQVQREATKFDRMILFGQALPALRKRLDDDLRKRGLPHEKLLAAVVSLLGTTFIRVGNAEYARDNESYGLTTLTDDHATVQGTEMTFTFRGKSGKDHVISLRDKRLAKVVKESQELPGQHLFQYVAEDGMVHGITSNDVNDYLKVISDQPFTAKDFRTWGGTKLAVQTCDTLGAVEGLKKGQIKKHLTQMVKTVADTLGNTPTVCRKYYIHSAIGEAWTAGTLLPMLEKKTKKGETADPYDLDVIERVVIEILVGVRQEG